MYPPAKMDVAVARSLAAELPPLIKLLTDDPRYKLEAYQFIGSGLEFAQEASRKGKTKPPPSLESDDDERPVCHISGGELCHALRILAHQQYGYMARLVLASWGIHTTSDFGEIVYNLIKIGKMSKSENDRREDFDNVYDFEQALVREFAITKGKESCRR